MFFFQASGNRLRHSKVVLNIFEKAIKKVVQLDLNWFHAVADNCHVIPQRCVCVYSVLSVNNEKQNHDIFHQKLFCHLCLALVYDRVYSIQ